MTTKIPYMVTSDKLVITLDQRYYTVSRDDKRFNSAKEAIIKNDVDLVREILNPKVEWRRPKTASEFFEGSSLSLLEDGRIVDSLGEELPKNLTDRMQGMMAEGFDAMPLEKFWNNLRENPNPNSKRMLWRFLQHQGHALTEDGYFIGYRGVTEDLKDRKTGTFDNSPGSVCKMPREDCDPNPLHTCSNGLHVGSYDYASSYGTVVVEVKVNPKNVVSVPVDYDGQKMRVCEFEVLAICNGRVDSELYETGREEKFTSLEWQCEEEVQEERDEELYTEVSHLIDEFGDSYTDDSWLAVRIAEELDGMWNGGQWGHLTPAQVLGIIGELRAEEAWTNTSKKKVSPSKVAYVEPTRNAKGQFISGGNQKRDSKGRFVSPRG